MSILITFNERLDSPVDFDVTLTLPFELRQKSRLRVTLDDGREAGLILSRGHILRGGDCLRADSGTVVSIRAAEEEVSTVTHDNPDELVRAAYHLGNRHVALQVGKGWIRYLSDHVLDEMVESLGMCVQHEVAPFEPESGAYHGHSHSHSHSHNHDDDDHSHSHSHHAHQV
jgi:urease accessory protein